MSNMKTISRLIVQKSRSTHLKLPRLSVPSHWKVWRPLPKGPGIPVCQELSLYQGHPAFQFVWTVTVHLPQTPWTERPLSQESPVGREPLPREPCIPVCLVGREPLPREPCIPVCLVGREPPPRAPCIPVCQDCQSTHLKLPGLSVPPHRKVR